MYAIGIIRILSPIRIFSSAFSLPSVFSHPPSVSAIRIRIRLLSLPQMSVSLRHFARKVTETIFKDLRSKILYVMGCVTIVCKIVR